MNVQPDWVDAQIDHSVLKFAQEQALEQTDDDEFIKIDREKNMQDTGGKQLDVVFYDNRPIHMLQYIEEIKEWEELFKRKRKPAKRRRIVLLDEDETEECKRIIVHEAWLIENYGEEYINIMKENFLKKTRDNFLIINKGTFMEKTDLKQSHIKFTTLKKQ